MYSKGYDQDQNTLLWPRNSPSWPTSSDLIPMFEYGRDGILTQKRSHSLFRRYKSWWNDWTCKSFAKKGTCGGLTSDVCHKKTRGWVSCATTPYHSLFRRLIEQSMKNVLSAVWDIDKWLSFLVNRGHKIHASFSVCTQCPGSYSQSYTRVACNKFHVLPIRQRVIIYAPLWILHVLSNHKTRLWHFLV